jgi:hypothetical protein
MPCDSGVLRGSGWLAWMDEAAIRVEMTIEAETIDRFRMGVFPLGV